MKSKYRILACPHCGGPAKLLCNKSSSKGVCYTYVRCIVCGASGKTTRMSLSEKGTREEAERDAVMSWNLRSPAQRAIENGAKVVADQSDQTEDQAPATAPEAETEEEDFETFVFYNADNTTEEPEHTGEGG